MLPEIVNAGDSSEWSSLILKAVTNAILKAPFAVADMIASPTTHVHLPTVSYSRIEVRRFLEGQALKRFQALHRVFYRAY